MAGGVVALAVAEAEGELRAEVAAVAEPRTVVAVVAVVLTDNSIVIGKQRRKARIS
ncbi:MAG: hypothetical protein WB543_16115 [Candidatus Acidiferrum sp.]